MLEVHVRPATAEDSEAIWKWRNDPDTRAASVNTEEVSWADHQSWFARTLAADSRFLLVGEHAAEPIGVVRFDAVEHPAAQWEVSVNLAPTARGRRLSVPLLKAGHDWLRHASGPAPILALIRRDNAASLRAFAGSGYVTYSEDAEYVTMIAHFD